MKNSDFTNPLSVATMTRLAAPPKEPSMSLKARASFVVALNLKNLADATQIFGQKRDELIAKYAKRDEKKELVHPLDDSGRPDETRVTIEDLTGFNKELADLLGVEPEIKITKLRPEALEEAKLSPSEILSILWMIDGD